MMMIMGLWVHCEALKNSSGLIENVTCTLLWLYCLLVCVEKACLWLMEGLNLALASG